MRKTQRARLVSSNVIIVLAFNADIKIISFNWMCNSFILTPRGVKKKSETYIVSSQYTHMYWKCLSNLKKKVQFN